MSEKINAFYTDVLHYAKLHVDDQGLVWMQKSNDRSPFTVDGKHLCLPTQNNLRHPKEKIMFHPLTEDINRGESPVIEKLKLTLAIQINQAIHNLGHDLLNIVAAPDKHNLLTPEQSQLVINVKKADEKTLTDWEKLADRAVDSGTFTRFFFSIFLRRGGEVGGKRFARAGIVNFPFYDELRSDNMPKGVTRKRDVQTYIELLEFMFPEDTYVESYSYGSTNMVAPFLDALLSACAKVTMRINELARIYKDFIPDADSMKFDDSFMDQIRNLQDLSNLIPPQAGNAGALIDDKKVEPAPAATPAPVLISSHAPAPTAAPAPARSTGITYREIMAKALAADPRPMQGYGGVQMPTGLSPVQAREMYEATRMPSWALPNHQQPAAGFGVPATGYGAPVAAPVMMAPQQMMQPVMMPQQPMMQPTMIGIDPTTGQPVYANAPINTPGMVYPAGYGVARPVMAPQGYGGYGGYGIQDERAAR